MKKFIVNAVGAMLVFVSLYMMILVGKAYEEHKLCLNGAVEYCIPEDFEQRRNVIQKEISEKWN